jgi:hypothetical protein
MEHPLKGQFDESLAVWQTAENPDGSPGRIGVAFVDDLIGMRDMTAASGPILVFTPAEWAAFLGGVRDGEFDLSLASPVPGPSRGLPLDSFPRPGVTTPG